MYHLSRCVRIIRKILKESKACVDSLKNLTLTNNPQVDELVAGAPKKIQDEKTNAVTGKIGGASIPRTG